MRHRCPKRIQNDGGKPYVSAGINSFFVKLYIIHEVAAPYHPESNGMAERLIWMLKDRLHHVNNFKGLNYKET